MKKFNKPLFKQLEKTESELHKEFGFSVKRQKIFQPLYEMCSQKMAKNEDKNIKKEV